MMGKFPDDCWRFRVVGKSGSVREVSFILLAGSVRALVVHHIQPSDDDYDLTKSDSVRDSWEPFITACCVNRGLKVYYASDGTDSKGEGYEFEDVRIIGREFTDAELVLLRRQCLLDSV